MRALFLGLAALALGGLAESAAAQEMARVAVLAHPVARGERIAASDFGADTRPLAMARGTLTAEEAAGMEAVRNLSEGAAVRRADLIQPQLVRRGEPVAIRYVSGGLTIASTGRALASAGAGEMVRVVVTPTSRTLDAFVEGPGAVRVLAP